MSEAQIMINVAEMSPVERPKRIQQQVNQILVAACNFDTVHVDNMDFIPFPMVR